MIDLGYMAKRVAARPDWLDVSHVRDVWAVSNCVSNDFCDYIDYWKHNHFWFFDSPSVIQDVAREDGCDLSDTSLVFYRGYHLQFDMDQNKWVSFSDSEEPNSAISAPTTESLLGYDIVTYSLRNSPECSPLSCNGIAANVQVNQHCLIDSLEYAIEQLEHGAFNRCEPGPFRIIAVSQIDW